MFSCVRHWLYIYIINMTDWHRLLDKTRHEVHKLLKRFKIEISSKMEIFYHKLRLKGMNKMKQIRVKGMPGIAFMIIPLMFALQISLIYAFLSYCMKHFQKSSWNLVGIFKEQLFPANPSYQIKHQRNSRECDCWHSFHSVLGGMFSVFSLIIFSPIPCFSAKTQLTFTHLNQGDSIISWPLMDRFLFHWLFLNACFLISFLIQQFFGI